MLDARMIDENTGESQLYTRYLMPQVPASSTYIKVIAQSKYIGRSLFGSRACYIYV